MKIIAAGLGEVSLSQNDFVAAGGEGAVYAKGDRAYKIYSDPARAIPAGKIAELSVLSDPRVIKPTHLVTDRSGAPLGYAMRRVTGARPLSSVLSRSYRKRSGLSHAIALRLVQTIQARMDQIHRAGVLLVDVHEMNFLVDGDHGEVSFIDVDSYQTQSYRAQAILPSVRDYSVPEGHFSVMTDWFSFAIVSFQLFTGIHPYKGSHKCVHGLEERMRQNLTVFDKDVTVPAACYPFDVIPPPYRAFYEAVLVRGERIAPPSDRVTAAPVVARVSPAPSCDRIEIREVASFSSTVVSVFAWAGERVVATEDGIYLGGRRVLSTPRGAFAVGFSPRIGRPVLATVDSGLQLVDLQSRAPLSLALGATSVMASAGRLYAHLGDSIVEIVLHDGGASLFATPRVVARVLPLASRLYEGVAMQSLLGAVYASVFPRSGESLQLRLPELDGYSITDAKCDGSVLMVIGAERGRYDRLVFRFNHAGQHDVRAIRDVDSASLDFVTLDSGVAVAREGRSLEVFSSSIGDAALRTIDASTLSGDLSLAKEDGRLLCMQGGAVGWMRMRA